MVACDRVRPLLFRFQEGEASPQEAMLVARHLPDCTGCRILLARESRLAKILAEDLDDLPVGEDFVRSVMATLPNELPPLRLKPAKRKLRGLKLAGFMALAALPLIPTAVGSGPNSLSMAMWPGSLVESVASLALSVVSSIGSHLPLYAPYAAGWMLALAALMFAALAGTASTLHAVVERDSRDLKRRSA